MSDPYIGEIRMFGGNFAPEGWAFCNGQLLPISENSALYQLIGTTYGGDGQNTFGLPNLQGRLPIHQGTNSGSSYTLGTLAGTETVTLLGNQIPIHSHAFNATTGSANTTNPSGTVPASGYTTYYTASSPPTPTAAMAGQSIGQAGGNQPHANLMPSLAVSFIISLYGVFPSQS